ncbi:ribosomal RNA small subunit methyltransferase A [bacterium]|nr:ribosomal RNA small subunit methyltransferase A [bacterium]
MSNRRSQGPRARKSLGQHFLRDSGVLADIVAAIDVPEGGLIVEIGAGTGQLTAELAATGHEIVAIEIEPRLVRHLRDLFSDVPNVQIVTGDARLIDYGRVVTDGRPFVAVGNLPYFAASPIIRRLLEGSPQPASAVVMVQREVAREIAAPVGKLSLQSLGVQVYAEPRVLFDVPPEAFDPPPAVFSSMVYLNVRAEPLVPRNELDAFFDFVSRAFRNPRKQLHNALTRETSLTADEAHRALHDAGIDGARRAETLSIGEWRALLAAARPVQVLAG